MAAICTCYSPVSGSFHVPVRILSRDLTHVSVTVAISRSPWHSCQLLLFHFINVTGSKLCGFSEFALKGSLTITLHLYPPFHQGIYFVAWIHSQCR